MENVFDKTQSLELSISIKHSNYECSKDFKSFAGNLGIYCENYRGKILINHQTLKWEKKLDNKTEDNLKFSQLCNSCFCRQYPLLLAVIDF